MRVQKSIEQMLDKIEFKKIGAFILTDGSDVYDSVWKITDELCSAHRFLDDYYELVAELIANSLLRGNKKDPYVMASAKVLLGKRGWILRLRDSGEGFDVDETLRTGKHQFGGCGLKDLNSRPNLYFNYEDNGSTLNIMGAYKPHQRIQSFPNPNPSL